MRYMRYIDLLDSHGHKRDHGFEYGAEFDVRVRPVDIPEHVRQALGTDTIDAIWWDEANARRGALQEALRKRYKWIGQAAFVGRGPGWLAIEDTVGKRRNWEPIAEKIEAGLEDFVRDMESEKFWRMHTSDLGLSGARCTCSKPKRRYVFVEWTDPSGQYHGGNHLETDLPKIFATLKARGVRTVVIDEDREVTL